MSRYKITLVYDDEQNQAEMLTTRAAIGVSMIEGVTMVDSGWQLMDKPERSLQSKSGYSQAREDFDQKKHDAEEIFKLLKAEQVAFYKGMRHAQEIRQQPDDMLAQLRIQVNDENGKRSVALAGGTPPEKLDVDWVGLFPWMPESRFEARRRDQEAQEDARVAREHDAITEELMVGLRCKSVEVTWLNQGETTGRVTEGHGRDIRPAMDAVRRAMGKLKKLYPNRRFLLEVKLKGVIGAGWIPHDLDNDYGGGLA